MTQTGLTLGTAAVSLAGSGIAWSNPNNVLTYGTPRATVGFTKDNQQSNRLAVSGFGLPIPVGNTILGISVELAFLQNQGAAPGHIVSVVLRDAAGDNSTLGFLGLSFATNGTLTLGNSTNLWAPIRPWTDAAIRASTFGVALAVGAAASGTTGQTLGIGSVRINVWSECRWNTLGIGRMGIGMGG